MKIKGEDLSLFHDYNLYLPTRTIWLGTDTVDSAGNDSGTDAIMAERLIKNIKVLESDNSKPITIIMNNIGGDVYHGLAIYDAIKASPCHVTIKVYGSAQSMGSVILQAADLRIMSPNAAQMIHYGHFSTSGHVKTAYRQTEENKRLDNWMEKMYLERIRTKIPNFSIQRLKGILDHDYFLDAKRSVEYGLADKIEGK